MTTTKRTYQSGDVVSPSSLHTHDPSDSRRQNDETSLNLPASEVSLQPIESLSSTASPFLPPATTTSTVFATHVCAACQSSFECGKGANPVKSAQDIYPNCCLSFIDYGQMDERGQPWPYAHFCCFDHYIHFKRYHGGLCHDRARTANTPSNP